MKRFYREVALEPVESGHRVLLDRRPVRTPAKQEMRLPSRALAQAVVAEWRAQNDTIDPATMPITRMASTATDRMPALRTAAIDEAAGYAATDLVCYRAAGPATLVERQRLCWQPLVEWSAEALGARLEVTTGVVPVEQPPAALARLRAAVEMLPDWPLVGLHVATTALGSLVLGLALQRRRLTPEAAFKASLLDELFEIEQWGWDVLIERRHKTIRRDVEAAATFLAALPPAAGIART